MRWILLYHSPHKLLDQIYQQSTKKVIQFFFKKKAITRFHQQFHDSGNLKMLPEAFHTFGSVYTMPFFFTLLTALIPLPEAFKHY